MANNMNDTLEIEDLFVTSRPEQANFDESKDSTSKPKHAPLPFKDLVQRGDPVPGIYKACDGTAKSFRVFLPSEFRAKKLWVFGSEVPQSDPNDPVLRVLCLRLCSDGNRSVLCQNAKRKRIVML